MTVYLLALGAALLFAAGSVVQQRVAFDAPPGKTLKLSLLLWLVRQPVWLIGVGTAFVGNLLAAAALGLGSVALVQPLLVSRLLFALPLAAAWMRESLARRDWLGAAFAAGGLGTFIAVGNPQPAAGDEVPIWKWVVTGGSILFLTFAIAVLTRRLGPARQAPLLGAGAGMLFGLQSALTHVAAERFFEGGPTALLLEWATYAVPVVAVLGTLLAQSAYELAPLPASYPALAAVEPLAGVGISVGVLGATIAYGPLPLAIALLALTAMTWGIAMLATSPLVVGHRPSIERRRIEEEAYRVERQIESELTELEDSLQLLAGRAHTPTWRERRAGLRDRARRVDAQLERLAQLVSQTARTGDRRNGLARHEQAMDRWQRDIELRQKSLQTRRMELQTRIDEAG